MRTWCLRRGWSTERLDLEPLSVAHATELAPRLDDASLHEFTGGAPLSAAALTARYARLAARRSPEGGQMWGVCADQATRRSGGIPAPSGAGSRGRMRSFRHGRASRESRGVVTHPRHGQCPADPGDYAGSGIIPRIGVAGTVTPRKLAAPRRLGARPVCRVGRLRLRCVNRGMFAHTGVGHVQPVA
jgi:hypothetical protein